MLATLRYVRYTMWKNYSDIIIYKCFQEDLMEGVIKEEDREDREATKEDDIEYTIGLLGLVPPTGDPIE